MVQLHVVAFVALLQGLLIVTAVWLIWWLRLRRTRALLDNARALLRRLREQPGPAVFLEQELRTVEELRDAGDDPPLGQAVHQAVLAHELERARAAEAGEPPSHDALHERIEALLAPPAPPAEPAPEAEAAKPVEYQDLQEMIARLDRQLEALRSQIKSSVTNTVDRTRMTEKLDALNLVTRELESCARILEQENDTLRAELQALKPGD